MKKLFLLLSAVFLSVVFLSVPTTLLAQNPTVSASKVTFRYCTPTTGVASIDMEEGEYNGIPLTQKGVEVVVLTNVRGCDSIVTLTVTDTLEGAIQHAFSISATQRVFFSRGNLQFCPTPQTGPTTHVVNGGGTKRGIWRFAEHQWDWVGDSSHPGNVYVNGTQCINDAPVGDSYNGWIDLFKQGETGYYTTSGSTYYRPSTYYEYRPSDGYAYTPSTSTTGTDWARYISGVNTDFGKYNAISNGGDEPGKWFLLSNSEWTYLLNTRTDAANKHAGAQVNGVYGLVILPDVWTLPTGCSFVGSGDAFQNQYTITQWEKMEGNGAIFFPYGTCGQYQLANYSYAWYRSGYTPTPYTYCIFNMSFITSENTFTITSDANQTSSGSFYNSRLLKDNYVRLVRYAYH